MALSSSAMFGAAAAVSCLLCAVVMYWWISGTRRAGTVVGKVSQVIAYPVKSARGVAVRSGRCLLRGLEGDRRWVVINTSPGSLKIAGTVGSDLNRLHYPKLAELQPSVSILDSVANSDCGSARPGEMELTLSDTGGDLPDLKIGEKEMRAGRIDRIQVLRMACNAYDCGDEAAEWLAAFLDKTGLRLYYMPEDAAGRVCSKDLKWGDVSQAGEEVSFAAVSPYLVCTEQSLNDVGCRLDRKLEMERFRPNIVVNCSDNAAYAEDRWKRFSVSGTFFHTMKRCGRCPLTQQDPMTGDSNVRNLLSTLREYRLDGSDSRHGNAPIFGLQVAAESEGMLRVGDVVAVHTYTASGVEKRKTVAARS